MKLYKSIFITIITIFLFADCETNDEVTYTREITNYDKIEVPVLDFIHHNISSKKDTIITTKGGISIIYNSEIGNKCGIDTLGISLKEYVSMYDLIMDGVHTVSDSGILESGGMLYLDITNDVDKTDLAKAFKVDFPDDKDNRNMELFIRDSSDIEHWKRDKADWMPWFYSENMTPEEIKNKIDTYFKANLFSLDKFGWINCDAFLEFENLVDYDVVCEDKNVLFYTIFTNSNTLLLGEVAEENIYKLGKLPKEESISILGIAYKEDVLYYNMVDAVVNEQKLEFPELKKITREKLKEIIDSKFGDSFI